MEDIIVMVKKKIKMIYFQNILIMIMDKLWLRLLIIKLKMTKGNLGDNSEEIN